nr:hypothetical protein [Cryobacterium breve]
MSVTRLTSLIRRSGRIAEQAPPVPALFPGAGIFGGSIQVRFINAGGCNDCAQEVASAFGPVYDVERYGVRLVASPRHADVLLICGSVTRNMIEPLRRTVVATPTPASSSPSATARSQAASSPTATVSPAPCPTSCTSTSPSPALRPSRPPSSTPSAG